MEKREEEGAAAPSPGILLGAGPQRSDEASPGRVRPLRSPGAPANPGSPASPSRPPGRDWVVTPPAGRDLGRKRAVGSQPELQVPGFLFPPVFAVFSSGRISGTPRSQLSPAVPSPVPY